MAEQAVAFITEEQHQRALKLFAEADYAGAARALAEVIKQEETCERWNDWATAQLMLGDSSRSEQGYRRALELDPGSGRVAGNLGALLACDGRMAEARPLLEHAAKRSTGAERDKLQRLIQNCYAQQTSPSEVKGDASSGLLLQIAKVINQQSQAIARLAGRVATLECGRAPFPVQTSHAAPTERPARSLALPHSLFLTMPCTFLQGQGQPILAATNERIVEIPFVHRNLPYPFKGRILDVGSRESTMAFEVSALGFETWAIDIREPLVRFPGVTFLRADIRSSPLETESFDTVIALSTIEHIGLIYYENTDLDEDGDTHALCEIYRVLKPNGTLLLTVPFGQCGKTDWYRVYDHAALERLLANCGFAVKSEDYWRQNGLRWEPTTWRDAERVDSLTQGARAVACVVAQRMTGPSRQVEATKRGAARKTGKTQDRSSTQSGMARPIESTGQETNHDPAGTADARKGSSPSQPTPRPGVFFNGFVYGGSGFAEETWMVVLGLEDRQIEVKLVPAGESQDTQHLIPEASRIRLESLQHHRIDIPKSVIFQSGPASWWNLDQAGRCGVGRAMFETEAIPEMYRDACNAMDEVWLPSRFNMETFARSGVDERKLRLVPGGVDTGLFQPGVAPLEIPKRRGFNFLSVFDWRLGKGYDVLLTAYLQEFNSTDDDVALVLKVSQSVEKSADLEAQITHFTERVMGIPLEKAPAIVLIKGVFPQEEMPRLYASASAFVLPSRGEGYGRPYLEALACQLPVIATRWSGQMDFLCDENSYLIESRLAPVPSDVDVEAYQGQSWAEPSVDHLRELMREVCAHPEKAIQKAERGRDDVVRNYDWSVVIPQWVNEFQRLLN